jgi:hypothetical protein
MANASMMQQNKAEPQYENEFHDTVTSLLIIEDVVAKGGGTT